MNVVLYRRVSTAAQEISQLGLMAQETMIANYLKRLDHQVLGSYTEIVSGTKKDDDRPILKEALNLCKLTNSTLVFAKLDRLYRNITALSTLLDSGVKFICVDNPEASDFILKILGCCAEKEAMDIRFRVKVALAEAKKRGTILGSQGRFNLKEEDKAKGRIEAAKKVKSNALEFAKRIEPIIRECQKEFMTLSEIAAHLTKLQVKTARGKEYWYPSMVLNCIKKLEAK